MREIKFRGKRIDNGEWVYGDIIHSAWKTFTKDCNDKYTNPRRLAENTADFRCIEVAPSTTGQYTGLKDKNGVGIFEGDVVNAWGGECCQGVWEFTNYNRVVNDLISDTFDLGHYEYLEVIGNIHDNPDLLEVTE